MDSDFSGFLKSLGSDYSLLLIVLGIAALMLFLLRRRLQGVSHPDDEPQLPPKKSSAIPASVKPGFASSTLSDVPANNSIEVVESDPLAEAAVYFEFGYFDHAAQVLRAYVDGAGCGNREVLRKLLHIYLRIERIDDYAEIVERLWDAGDDPTFVQSAILSGLASDVDNLQLRVLAESALGLGIEKLNKLLGIDEGVKELMVANDDELSDASKAVAGDKAAPINVTNGHAAYRQTFRLIDGGMRLDASFSPEEKAMLRVFSHPAHEARLHRAEARMHRASGNWDSMIDALRRAIAACPTALVNHADLLWVLYRRKRHDEYARSLWHLYLILNGAGRALRERFLGMGLALGQHQLLEELLRAGGRGHYEEVGRRFGLLPRDGAAERRLSLVEAVAGEVLECPTTTECDVLVEVDSYLQFGQIDEAIDVLERAIFDAPSEAHLYPVLFDLYDRMDALDRLMALSAGVRKVVQRPPEEIVPMMHSLQQRLQQRKQGGRRVRGAE